MNWYVYVLRKDGELYIGYTGDLKRRIAEHVSEAQKGCKFLYCEVYTDSGLAREREQKLKQYGSAWRALKKRILKAKRAG